MIRSAHTILLLLLLLALSLVSASEKNESIETNNSVKRHLRSLDNPNLKAYDHSLSGPQLFQSIVNKQVKYSDKIVEHKYSEMYGTFLIPHIRRIHQLGKPLKFLEIGLGCDENMKETGTEARGVKVWKGVLAEHDELWIAEYDGKCVEKATKHNLLTGAHMLIGDQGNREVLDAWIKTSGGQFDVVVDDGGHFQHHIFNSFAALWPQVKPGGLYFIEDLQVARQFIDKGSNFAESVMDYIHNWQEYMVTGQVLSEQTAANLNKYKPPPGIRFIACQSEACIIAKCEDMSNQVTRCT